MHCQTNALRSPVPQPATPVTGRQSARTARADDADRDLLRRISGADRDAFRELYFHYHQRLARFLARVLRHAEDVEEVINDAFMVVWQRASDFRGAARVSTWIFGIAYRRALMAIRRSSSRSRTTDPAFHDDEEAADDTTKATEDRQLVDFWLAHLPPEQRLVLVLAYRMDYSCAEIAAIARCPVNTVKSRMLHARRKLRTIISTSDTLEGPASCRAI